MSCTGVLGSVGDGSGIGAAGAAVAGAGFWRGVGSAVGAPGASGALLVVHPAAKTATATTSVAGCRIVLPLRLTGVTRGEPIAG
ncbi:hypothetical protein GCM10023225_15970 [Kineococcus glutinatus]|uniref:Uncharacterized protein n=1 Tax=Kineococcus glutinatus TaxID=1070872 RepID=A0ABP9HQA1_9ACTN